MDVETNVNTDLPENAYRELEAGEEYKPVMPLSSVIKEVTPWSVFWGIIMAIVFSGAAAFSGLKIGQVIEAAIPISIIAVGLSTAFKKKNMLGQNVIIQSIGGSSGVVVAGAIFTIPGLYILGLDVNFFHIFIAAFLGACLGILFLIPFRRYFVKDMHGKFPFPEAKATTEILMSGEKGGNQAKALIVSGLIAGIYDFICIYTGLFAEEFTSRVVGWGAQVADKSKILFRFGVSPLIVGFGYLVGLRYSLIIAMGSLFAWFVLVPLFNQAALMAGSNFFAGMAPEIIFKEYVRYIGIGAIAMAGMIGIVKSSKVIGSAFKLAFGSIFGKSDADETVERTQRDIKMSFIMMMIALTAIALLVFLITGFNISLAQAVVAFLTIVIISFLFTTVAANAIAIVGSNPVSGMTLMTLLIASFTFAAMGLKGNSGMTTTLVLGGIVCTALSVAGGFITDLKVGYWLGSTPRKQESWKFLGMLVSAATVGVVIFMLNSTFGFTDNDYLVNQKIFTRTEIKSVVDSTASPELMARYKAEKKNAKPLVAPQANAMAAVISPIMSDKQEVKTIRAQNINGVLVPADKKVKGEIIAAITNAKGELVPAGKTEKEKANEKIFLYLLGALVALLLNFIGIPPLAFALGMYLPLQLNTPLVAGGLLAYYVSKSSKDKAISLKREQRGTLIASGFIAGAALFGIIGALLKFFGVNIWLGLWDKNLIGGEIAALVAFVVLFLYFVWDTYRADKIKE
ncbi:MAG: oligopeptide transporter, OPT family [bacterium]